MYLNINKYIILMYSKSEIILQSLYQYYLKDNNNNLNIILPILLGQSKLSISLFNWFITNYIKKNYINIKIKDKTIDLYLQYKLQLKSYKKILFDPFSRSKRIKFYLDNTLEKYLITTIGQLNFFRWIIDNGIIEYLLLNFDDLKKYNNKL